MTSKPFEGLGAFARGITSLPPGREMCWTLGGHAAIAEENSFQRHHVKISYDTVHGPREVEYDLDYGDGDGTAIRDGGTIKKLTTAVEKLTRAVAKP